MLVVVYGAMMVLGLIGMIVCSKKQRTNPSMQPVAFVLFVVVIIGAILLMKETGIFGSNRSSLLANERAFYASQGHKVGEFLKSSAPGKKVLVLAELNYETNPNLKELVDQFKAQYGEDVVVDTLTLPGNMSENQMPLYMVMKAKDFDAAIEKHEDAGVIISLIGLPNDTKAMKYWRTSADKRPQMVLVGLPSGRVDGLVERIKKGDIAAIVISSPDAKYDVKAPGDAGEAFGIRYVLVTKQNVDKYRDSLR